MSESLSTKKFNGMNFSERLISLLKFLHESRGITQKIFAQKLGIVPGHVTNLKKGANASAQLIKSISSVFAISEEWMLTGEGEMLSADALKTPGLSSKETVLLEMVREDEGLLDDVIKYTQEKKQFKMLVKHYEEKEAC